MNDNHGKMLIDLGCGRNPVEGYFGVDDDPHVRPSIVADCTKHIPGLASGCAARVVCRHVLEHIKYPDWAGLAYETLRLLKDGGEFQFAVPHPSWDSAMIYGHVHVFTPRLWREYQAAGPIAKDEQHGLYIESVVEKPIPETVAFCKAKGLDFEEWKSVLRNTHDETVVTGRKLRHAKK